MIMIQHHWGLISSLVSGNTVSVVCIGVFVPFNAHSIHSADSRGNPRCITNSKGRKRRPGTRDLTSAIKTNDVLFLDFIRRCLEWDPKRRMSPEDALRHSWIQEVS